YARVREILDAEPEIQEPVSAQELPGGPSRGDKAGSLEVRGLSFELGGRRVLEAVSFSVKAGERLATVGRTGSGKSVLAGLLARLLPTPEGAVFLDGVDVTKLRLSALRKAIGYAPQEAFLFSTTVGRNIGFALDEVDTPAALERVRHAAEEAAVRGDIER